MNSRDIRLRETDRRQPITLSGLPYGRVDLPEDAGRDVKPPRLAGSCIHCAHYPCICGTQFDKTRQSTLTKPTTNPKTGSKPEPKLPKEATGDLKK